MDANQPIAKLSGRLQEARRLLAIEGNPLTADEFAMFEMFERENWFRERRRSYIQSQFQASADCAAE
jgi:hypothetical protein